MSPLQVRFSFHPTFQVPTLDEARDFFRQVFNRQGQLLVMFQDTSKLKPGQLPGYSEFVFIRDLLLDYLSPQLHTALYGKQMFPDVDEPVLQNIGWYSDDMTGTFRALRAAGIPLVDQ